MSARDEIRDPWGWLVAAVCGGLAWAVLAGQMGVAAVLMGLLIGTVVLGTKVAVGAIRDRGQEPRQIEAPRDRLPQAPRGSVQAGLLAALVRGSGTARGPRRSPLGPVDRR